MSSIKEYYVIRFLFELVEYYAIWYTSEDMDGFVLCNGGHKIVSFPNFISARSFARKKQYNLIDGITTIFCGKDCLMHDATVDCEKTLDFWNIISDVAKSLHLHFTGDEKNTEVSSIYDKLFYGCNLPVMKQEHEVFLPDWKPNDLNLIADIIAEGVDILLNSFDLEGESK